MSFDQLPVFMMAVLACWLSLSLLARSPRDRLTQVFAWLGLNLTLYGLSAVLPALTHSPEVSLLIQRIHAAESVVLTPILPHFMLLLAGHRAPRWQWVLSMLFYAAALPLALLALFSPVMQPDTVAGWPTLRFPDGPLQWAWLFFRIAPLLLALLVLYQGYRRAAADDLERRRYRLIGLAAPIGVAGALWVIAARELRWPLAPGHILMVAALALFAYSVLAYRSLLPERVVQRTFYRSFLGGLLTALFAGALISFEPLVAGWLQVDFPLLTIFSLVALAAVFGPLRDWAGEWLDRRFFHREFDYGRLLRDVSGDLLQSGDLAPQLQAALTSICSVLGVRAGLVAVQEGTGPRVQAAYGLPLPAPDAFRAASVPDEPELRFQDWPLWPDARLLLPVRRATQTLGLLALGEKRSGEPYSPTERELLASLCAYMALAIQHDRNHQAEQLAMAALVEQGRQLREEQAELARRAAEQAEQAEYQRSRPAEPIAPPAGGLRVYALGPLRAERNGSTIDRWGGDKAGTYQAEALFAFLFDRRGRGLTKDEAAEVIWPDLDIEKSDAAFHRTVSALRRTLEPGLRRANESRAITYHHERYWLNPELVAWCDIDEFTAEVERSHTLLRQERPEEARVGFARALALYRGDYMDDCPFFGDSSSIETRRAELRDQRIEALLALGAIYERLNLPGEAATCYRRAIAAADGECPRAEERLADLVV